MVDVELESIQASITLRMLILQHEVWHYHATNKLFSAFPGVLLQRGLIVDSKAQQ